MENDIFINQPQPTAKPSQKGPVLIKAIIIIFALIIAVEVLMGLKQLLTPIKVIPKPQVINTISDGSILLSSPKSSYKVGEVVPITVKVRTGGHLTAGVDLVLKYDPNKLSASPSSFIKGTTYDDYPPINIDLNGNMRISGLVSTNKPGFNGSGDFGTINFIAKQIGVSDISLGFTPNLTNNSNMVEVGTIKNVLGQVSGVKINIQP